MDVVMRYFSISVIFLLLILIAMFFSSCEVAIAAISKGRLKKLADSGDKISAAVLKLKERQSDFSAYCSMSAIILIVAATLVGTYLLGEAIDNLLCSVITLLTGQRQDISHVMHHNHAPFAVIISVILSFFIAIILGNTLPKKLVLDNIDRFAQFAMKLLPALSIIFIPLTYIPIKIANGISRIALVDPNIDLAAITEDEIRMMVDAGNENGSIELSECEMINNIFEWDDLTVGEVMTHRTSISAVNINQPLIDVINIAINEGFSRIPVYENDIDNIVGTIYVKDLLVFANSNKAIDDSNIKEYIRSVIYTPESAECRVLFNDLKEKKTHMAVVVDEYGGTAGIITMEDLLEAIVGNIQDEYDPEEEEQIKLVENGSYSIDGSIETEEICKLFGIDITLEEHSETLAGLITNKLGYIPEKNQSPTVQICGVDFTVTKVSQRCIKRVLAKKIEKAI